MQILQTMSIRRKQTLIIMLTSSLALLLACAAFIFYDSLTFRRELSQRVTILADAIGNNCAGAIDFNDPKTAEDTLAALRADDSIVSACVYSNDGHVFAVYKRDTASVFVPPAARVAGEEFTGNELHLFRVIKQGGVTTGTIFVVSDLKDISARLASYIEILGIVFLTALLAALLLSSRLQRLVSSPILSLARVARTVAQDKNYSLRAKKQNDDEIGQLVDGFNEMLVQIQQRDAALQAARGGLERRVEERTKELAESLSVLNATLSSTADGILVVNSQGKKIFQNQRTVELWKIPPAIAESNDDQAQVRHVTNATTDPDKFREKVLQYYSHPDESGWDEIELKDGTIMERITAPVRDKEGRNFGRIWTFRDVTQSRMDQAALKESEANYYSLVDQMPAGIFRKDKEGRFIFVNSWFCQIKGTTADQLLGKSPGELAAIWSHGQNAKHSKEIEFMTLGINHHKLIMESGRRIELEEEYPDANGKMQHLHVVKSPVFDPNGKIIGTQGILFDISERKRAEAELSYERDLLRSLLDNSPDQIYFKDARSCFIKTSKALAVNFGFKSANEMVGKSDFDFFTEEHARPAFEDEQEIIRTGRPLIGRVEKEVWNDGRVTWVLTNKMPLRDKDGQIIGTFGISKNITELKRAEETLRESEERFSGAFNHAPIGVALVSPDGRWLKVNRALCDLVGYSEAEMLTRTFQDITYPEDFAADLKNVRRLLAGEIRTSQIEKRYVHSHGHLVSVSLNVSLVRDAQNRPLYFITQIQDITERKRLESQLFESQKMETVGKLAGGIAHEFNSILTAIIIQSDMLIEELPAGSPLAENAAQITQAAGRAATLTRQLLAYGRKQFLQPVTLDLNLVIAGMEGVIQHLMGNGVVTQIISAADLRAVKADAGQIEQVIMNIVINARDAMPNGGKLTLETANVFFGEDSEGRHPELKPGGYVMLAITDTGKGMSETVKARLFEPFFTTKDVGQGTGLGLSTCYGIIKQSGGHIVAYTEPGRGTTFKIYLPQFEHQPKSPIQRLDSSELPRGTENILLVENDPSLREMAGALLGRLGYTVFSAPNNIEALRLVQRQGQEHIDLLVTDITMSDMSGRELADRMRALFPQIKIIFKSAYTEKTIGHQDVLNKGVAFLKNPCTPSELAIKLREALDQPDVSNDA
jgi:PAS domain S-box-containing protein